MAECAAELPPVEEIDGIYQVQYGGQRKTIFYPKLANWCDTVWKPDASEAVLDVTAEREVV